MDQRMATNDFPDGLAAPGLRALHGAGYARLDQLEKVSEAELLALHGMGRTAIAKLRAALGARGKSFRDD
jgi:hypothetical protein